LSGRERSRVRPRVFIGSSAEGLPIAETLQVLLDYECEVEIWSQGVFAPGGFTLGSLARAAISYDFAVLVVSPDDTTEMRGRVRSVTRDNVIFELGLFMGALGSQRTYMLFDRYNEPDLPSDLAGVTPITYALHQSGNLRSSLGAAGTQLRETFRRVGIRRAEAGARAGTPYSTSESPDQELRNTEGKGGHQSRTDGAEQAPAMTGGAQRVAKSRHDSDAPGADAVDSSAADSPSTSTDKELARELERFTTHWPAYSGRFRRLHDGLIALGCVPVLPKKMKTTSARSYIAYAIPNGRRILEINSSTAYFVGTDLQKRLRGTHEWLKESGNNVSVQFDTEEKVNLILRLATAEISQ
jgi:hypothetical protein